MVILLSYLPAIVPVSLDILLPEMSKLLRNLLWCDFLQLEDKNTCDDDAEDVDESQGKAGQSKVEGLHGKIV